MVAAPRLPPAARLESAPVRTLLALALVTLAAVTEARAAEVVVLKWKDIGPYNEAVDGLREKLGDRATIIDLGADEKQGAAFARQAKSADLKVVVAVGAAAARIARQELGKVPLVYCMVLQPEKESLSGEGITGVQMRIPYEPQFELLRTVLPKTRVVGVVFDPSKSNDEVTIAKQEAAQKGLELISVGVKSESEVPAAIGELADKKVDVLWLSGDSTVLKADSFPALAEACRARKLPIMGYQVSFVKSGALIALATSYRKMGLQAAGMAMKVMGGADISEVPVEAPDGNVMALNLAVAKGLGITIPESIIAMADVLVEE